MKYTYKGAVLWLTFYLLLCLVPLGIAVTGSIPEYRGFWTEFAVALGFIALAVFALEFIFSGRLEKIAPSFGMDNILHFHRQMGIIAFFLVFAHPVILMLTNPEFTAYFDPRVNAIRAVALSFVTVAVALIIVSSLWRLSLGLSYEKWRLLHGFLALSIVFTGVVHSIQVGHYLDTPEKKIMLAILMAGSMYLVIHTRIVRPWLNKKKPYKITEVNAERDECWSIRVRPQGHSGIDFTSGQFAWITVRETPFSLQQHPFTIASGEEDDSYEFTAKAEGDFTSSFKDMKIGQKAFLEGPFGSFTPKKDKNLFLIMGGIGITPAMSMLRTFRDQKDRRKIILIYGSNEWENVAFREELEELKESLGLKLVHLLLNPPPGWSGEAGVVSKDLLEKYMPEDRHAYFYYICGPGPMMDISEIALRDLGIDWRHIYSERFQIV